MNLQQVTSILRANKDFISSNFNAEVKGIFGSYSRGEQTEKSDLDILVSFGKGATLITQAALMNFLQEKTGINVDVVSERAVKTKLRSFIESDLIKV